MNKSKLKKLFRLDKKNGVIFWKKRSWTEFTSDRSYNTWNSRLANKIAGTQCSDGYIRVRINSKSFLVHRIIWIMVHGEQPVQIDHISGNTLDNRISNLRSVSHSGNLRNSSISKNNTSGVLGVSLNRRDQKWLAQIGNERLIYTKDFFLACCARKSAEANLGYHENHGRVKSA